MNNTHAIESEIQDHTILAAQEAVAAVEQQAVERLRIAVDEAEQKTRARITEELQARFEQEMAAALDAARNELDQAAARWQIERDQLIADCERSNQLLKQARSEHSLALAESDEAAAIALERQITTAVERVRVELTLERDRAIMQSLAERDAEHRETIEKLQKESAAALEQAKTAAEPVRVEKSAVDLSSIHEEVARIETLIHTASELIDDPEADLSIVIRKNAERAELESYLRGVRFSILDTN